MLLRYNLKVLVPFILYQFVSTTALVAALSLLIYTLHKKHTMDSQSVMH